MPWVIGLIALLLGYPHVAFAQQPDPTWVVAQELPHCVTQQEQREIRGKSMHGLLEPGDQIVVLHNYYDCRPVGRGDWVVFRYSGTLGEDLAFIKQAMGLPGDQLGVEMVEGQEFPAIQVNGSMPNSPDGHPYYVNSVGASYLTLALGQTHDGIIPRGHYWVLGTAFEDGWDSRRFGFIAHRDLMGKAVALQAPSGQHPPQVMEN